MNKVPISSRRQLFRLLAAGATSFPLAACKGGEMHHRGGGQHCFLKGTKISTAKGECPVQDLKIGDEVHTLRGLKPIKWIGYNRFTKEASRPWQDGVLPICMSRSAIADNAPHTDLYVSPWHAFNQALIPVIYLVNGRSIAPAVQSDVSELEYYNLEFDTHEVFYAEGVLVESFDGADRESFSNLVQYERLYGLGSEPKVTLFAPRHGYKNRVQMLNALARSLVFSVIDLRDPISIAHDQIAKRAHGEHPKHVEEALADGRAGVDRPLGRLE
jgi:hypothetical protein